MPETIEAHIRPYVTQDNKLVRFMIGKANFGVLGVANSRGTNYLSSLNCIY
jgi:hypothetical protein